MSVPTEEVLQHLDFIPEPAIDLLIREADADHLHFIPDDPAELRRAVTRMAAHINLADWRFIKLIAAMERTRGWQEGGYCNLGNWLDHRCGLGPCAARERIRIGRALARLPRIDAAFRDGVISYSKVRAITRVATPDTDAMLLAIAEGSSAAHLESLVRTYERVAFPHDHRPFGQRTIDVAGEPPDPRRMRMWKTSAARKSRARDLTGHRCMPLETTLRRPSRSWPATILMLLPRQRGRRRKALAR